MPTAPIEFARGVNATQLVLGSSRRGRWRPVFAPTGNVSIVAQAGQIDVLRDPRTGHGRPRATSGECAIGAQATRRLRSRSDRRPVVTLGLGIPVSEDSLPSVILLMLALVTAVALIGGMWPALLTAVAGSLAVNYHYTKPQGTLAVAIQGTCSRLPFSSWLPCP